jgi:hypothetical protein
VQALKDSRADVLVCYLPVGSEQAAKFYAQCAIDAKVAFVNALPVFIAGTPEWAEKFRAAGVPIVGDDIKSQVGATITHRVLAKLFEDRGVVLDRTMQLNVGGNMDFMNMLERDRLESKKISKTQAVTSQVQHDLGKGNVHIGPSDYVSWLDDRKWAYVRLEGRRSATCRSTWSTSSRSGTAPTRRCGHRRRPLLQGRQGPRDRRPAARPVLVLHEEPAGAVPGRRVPPADRGVRRGRRQRVGLLVGRGPGASQRCRARPPYSAGTLRLGCP